jgi:IS30 family transposase
LIEREEISRGIVEGRSTRAIAAALGRAPSTISREIRRNDGPQGYRASQADQAAWDRGCRPKVCTLVQNRELAQLAASKLRLEWSPEQVAGWLKRSNPDDEALQVSHETIYRSLFIQARGALKKELMAHLRRTRGMRRSRHHTQKTSIRGQITDAVSISERPPAVEDRALPGHWEGDLLFGSKNSQIRSLTWDRGKEMADHRRFTLATDIKVYFCDPRSPWQRGSNENANGLLRQYLPKGIDLSGYSQPKLNAIARRLNERPRKTLQYETSAQRFQQAVASTG